MPAKILIVDDQRDALEVLSDLLDRQGYETVTAQNGSQALALAEEVRPDAVLLDVMMPEMNGVETCRRLRMNPATADIPVILISSRSPSEARAEALEAGATDYVTKPVGLNDLLERIERLAGFEAEALSETVRSDRQRHEEALRRQTERLQALNRAANAISSAGTFQDVAQISVNSALEVARGVSASLLILDRDQPDTLTTLATAGPRVAEMRPRSVAWGEGLIGWVAHEAESRLITDLAADQALQAQYAPLYGPQVRSIIAVPLVTFDEVVGVLEVVDKQDGVLDEHDRETLESLAGSAAIAIENARLFDETRRRVTELSTLLDASAAATSTLDFGAILERIARRLSLALQVERVLVMGWHPESRRLETLAEVVNAYWPPGAGPARRIEHVPLLRAALESGAMKQARAVRDDIAAPVEEINPSGLRTAAVFPIRMSGRVVGALALSSDTAPRDLPPPRASAVAAIIGEWQAAVQDHDPEQWSSRPNLTDLSQRALQAGGLPWCGVWRWDQARKACQLLRETGRAIWADQPAQVWDAQQFPSMARALDGGEALTLRRDDLADDPNEQAYLRYVGGYTCLIAPLFIRGEPGGLVKLIDSRQERRVFDNAERSLCQGIAHVVGNAMENAQLYAEQERRASALEAAYNELREADQIKDDLLQNLSHELRTPLTHILGYLRLMLDNSFGALTREQIDVVELVTHKAERLAELLQDMLSAQEAEAGGLRPRPIHLDRVVAQAVRALVGQAEAQGIQLVPRIPANLPLAYADPDRMADVFKELLENAIKFSPNATPIEITLEDPGGLMLRASVRDFGIGIPPDEREKVFRRFYQVDGSTTRRFGGAGLGLAIARQIVEGHNGRIWVEGAANGGSCFVLTLPKATAMSE
jgi:signal transduction histidine kinase/CheY-like chemotaxis protein